MEFFHALTDGTGALSFLMTLAAEYLRLKNGVSIPAGGPVLDCRDAPSPEEMEDSFLRYARGAGRSRLERPPTYAPARRSAATSSTSPPASSRRRPSSTRRNPTGSASPRS